MWFAYIAESKDPEKFHVYTALITTGGRWAAAFANVKDFRKRLLQDHGVYVDYELHASKFVSGRGRPANRPIYKRERARIFEKTLNFVSDCGSFGVVTSCSTTQQYALERLLIRLNKTAERMDQQVLLFFGQGGRAEITKLARRIYDPNARDPRLRAKRGRAAKSIPLPHIIEDPIFKDSKQSYFLQLADFCAYAALRMERPLAGKTAYGLHMMYELLRPVSRDFTNSGDPRGMGIIRDNIKSARPTPAYAGSDSHQLHSWKTRKSLRLH